MGNTRSWAACLLALTLCLCYGRAACAADGAFTKGTTVSINLPQTYLIRTSCPTWGTPGTISVSIAGLQPKNEVILYGRRDGAVNNHELYWELKPFPTSVDLEAGQRVKNYYFPFGPSYGIPTLETISWTQTYKYTAIIHAGDGIASSSVYLTVQNDRYGIDVITPIIDETM